MLHSTIIPIYAQEYISNGLDISRPCAVGISECHTAAPGLTEAKSIQMYASR
jgi:hypothetical protein